MNKRALYFGYAVAWLAGVIILSQVIPYAKLGPAISGLFIGKKSDLDGMDLRSGWIVRDQKSDHHNLDRILTVGCLPAVECAGDVVDLDLGTYVPRRTT